LQGIAEFGIFPQSFFDTRPVDGAPLPVPMAKVVPRSRDIFDKLSLIEQGTKRTLHGCLERSTVHVNQQRTCFHHAAAIPITSRTRDKRERERERERERGGRVNDLEGEKRKKVEREESSSGVCRGKIVRKRGSKQRDMLMFFEEGGPELTPNLIPTLANLNCDGFSHSLFDPTASGHSGSLY
jgi:hypothetical protein